LRQHRDKWWAASIYDQAYKLKNYEPYRGVSNLAQLQAVYAPTPKNWTVSNDSRNLNRYWLALVQENMSEIG
jgi:hypothetical protein